MFIKQVLGWVMVLLLHTSCVSRYKLYQQKSACYEQQLLQIQQLPDYALVMRALADSLPQWRVRMPFLATYTIDSAVFFNKDHTKGLLILSWLQTQQRGVAHVVVAQKNAGNWELSFGKPHFSEVFDEKSLQYFPQPAEREVARLMRFKILVSGKASAKGCTFDETYWFNYFYE